MTETPQDPQPDPKVVEGQLQTQVMEMAKACGYLIADAGGDMAIDELAGTIVGAMGVDWTPEHKLYHMSMCYAVALKMIGQALDIGVRWGADVEDSVQELNTPTTEQEKP